MKTISMADIQRLLTCTRQLMNHVYWVQESFNLLPDKQHYGTCINHVDLQEFRDEFCKELVNTVPEWVYSQRKAATIIDDYIQAGRTPLNASAALNQLAYSKFRSRDGREIFLQGQFGELLLFNFLQSFFAAVPLLRKMPITTAPGMERNGADAIHYSFKENKHLIFLGESKTYSSDYQFARAFRESLESILQNYKNHRKELDLYIYDHFIDDELMQIARAYKEGTLENVEIHLVSIIVYNETRTIVKRSEAQIKADIMNVIRSRGQRLDRKMFELIEPGLHPRFNYIILPIWELQQLIETFQRRLGL